MKPFRFLTCAHTAVTARASSILCRILTAILPSLRELYEDIFEEILGSRTCCFPVSLSSDCALKAGSIWHAQTSPAQRAAGVEIETTDITAFYNNIPQDGPDGLRAVVKKMAALALAKMGCSPGGKGVLRVTRGEAHEKITVAAINTAAGLCTALGRQYAKLPKKKDDEEPTNDLLVGLPEISNILDVVLDHALARFGETVFIQRFGIPMGTHSGAQDANIYGFNFEFLYATSLLTRFRACKARMLTAEVLVDRLGRRESTAFNAAAAAALAEYEELAEELAAIIDEAQCASRYARFIDDMYFLGNKYRQRLLDSFPKCITFEVSASNVGQPFKGVHFMDVFTQQASAYPHELLFTLYAKTRGMDYANVPKRQYTMASSFISQIAGSVNTLRGQWSRFCSIISEQNDFVRETVLVMLKLVLRNGAEPEPLIRALHKLAYTRPYLRGGRDADGNRLRPTTPNGVLRKVLRLFNDSRAEADSIERLTAMSPQCRQEAGEEAEREAAREEARRAEAAAEAVAARALSREAQRLARDFEAECEAEREAEREAAEL